MRHTFLRAVPVAVLAGLLVVPAGCGNKPKLVKVQGKVLFKDQPLTGGSIWFQPDEAKGNTGEKASCQLALDGAFTMRTYPHGDGVVPGTYKVTLAPELANRIGAPRYAMPHTTPLEVAVPDEGLSDLVLTIRPEIRGGKR
jgi:hypothetical protein